MKVYSAAVLNIKSKPKLGKAINQVDSYLNAAKDDLKLFESIVGYANGKYKRVMRPDFGVWDHVARIAVDSCLSRLSRLYDSPDFSLKGKSMPNLNLHSFLLEISYNSYVRKQIPAYSQRVLSDIPNDLKVFENLHLKKRLKRIRDKFLSHYDAGLLLSKKRKPGLDFKSIEKLVAHGIRVFAKYARLFPYDLDPSQRIYVISGMKDIGFGSRDLEKLLSKIVIPSVPLRRQQAYLDDLEIERRSPTRVRHLP